MSYIIALPQTLPAGFGIGFHMLSTATGALPYKVDGVATMGIKGEGAQQLPSLIGLHRSRQSTPLVPYGGSAVLSEMLDSSPRALMLEPAPFGGGAAEDDDFFSRAAKDGVSVRKLIAEHGGAQQIARLAFRYSEAAMALDRMESGRSGAALSLNDARDFLRSISPMALEAADRGALVMRAISARPYISYAKHCVLFLAGALSATFRHAECSRYAIDALDRMGNFFEEHDAEFKNGEGLAIKASGLEIVAEMLRVHRLPGEEIGFVYPQQIFPEIANTWLSHLERNPQGQDSEGVYLRALNAAQWWPDYEFLEKVLIVGNRKEEGDLGSAQFLIRAAWAVLMDEDGDRPEAERWDLIARYLANAEGHLDSGNVKGGDQLADVASKVRAKAENYAWELIGKN